MEKETRQVELFTGVAPHYEFLNSLMTVGQDRKWRETLLRASEAALGGEPQNILDLACGTGDVPRLMIQRWPDAKVTGTDPNPAMLSEARKKVELLKKTKPLFQKISWQEGRAEKLDFPSDSLDLVTIAFGFRNVPVEDRALALKEIFRTLRPGGVVAILELGLPRPGFSRSIYSFLLSNAMPHLAGLFSPKESYQYLAKSIREFPEPQKIKEMMQFEGFLPFAPKALSRGMCWLFIGRKALPFN